jgi:hypothetical protein
MMLGGLMAETDMWKTEMMNEIKENELCKLL